MIRNLILLLLAASFFMNAEAQGNKLSLIPETSVSSIEALSLYVKQNYPDDSSRMRAIFNWVADNISYDVPRFLAREDNPNRPPQPAEDVLKTRKAVCEGYTDLFIALCEGAGLKTVKISGYTKKQGRVSQVSHAWAAGNLDGKWYMFDPTWGAGYVKDDKFVKKYFERFYKVDPGAFISDHMPFDPIYQFVDKPLTNTEFIEVLPASAKLAWNCSDSVSQHLKLTRPLQAKAELRRMEAAGIQNDLLQKHKAHLLKIISSSESKDSYEAGRNSFKSANRLFKEYIDHKNQRFSTIEPAQLKQKMDSIIHYIREAREFVSEANPKTDAQRDAKAGMISNIDKMRAVVLKELEFVNRFLNEKN